MEPSRVLSATLPVKPSVTMTSAMPAKKSRPSTLPTNSNPAAGAVGQQGVGLLHQRAALGLLLADRQQGHPGLVDAVALAGEGRAHLGELHQHGRACTRRWPPSRAGRSARGRPGSGIGVAMAGRMTLGSRPMRSSAEAMAAPVLPAETMAMARPSRTASAARTSEESFFRRTPWAGSSSMPMTSLAAMSGSSRCHPSRPGGPTRTTSMSVFSATWRAPATISSGARSPPMASTATGSAAEGLTRRRRAPPGH